MNLKNKITSEVQHQKDIDKFIDANGDLKSFDYIDKFLQHFNFFVSCHVVENIPKTGRVVIIANHPLGKLDAFALLYRISKIRKDIKVISSDSFKDCKPLQPLLIDVNQNSMTKKKDALSKVYTALDDEMALIIFPSKNISIVTPKGIQDEKWNKLFLKIAKKSRSPILPIYIKTKNSKKFYSLYRLSKKLSSMLLANEIFNQKVKSIDIMIGNIILHQNIISKDIQKKDLIKLYKKHIYNICEKNTLFKTEAIPCERIDMDIAHPLRIKIKI